MTTQYQVAGSLIGTREVAIRVAIESWAGDTPASEWTEDQIRECLPGWCKAPEGVDQAELDAEVVQTAITMMLKGDKKKGYYMVTTGDGNMLCDGVSEHEIERIAQAWADHLAETVYYIESGTDLDSDDEDEGIAVEPRTVRCECGVWTGERCVWTGPKSETVVVEYMPEYLRASHRAAGYNGYTGLYPVNGAVRVRVERYCAGLLLLNEDERDWAQIVGD